MGGLVVLLYLLHSISGTEDKICNLERENMLQYKFELETKMNMHIYIKDSSIPIDKMWYVGLNPHHINCANSKNVQYGLHISLKKMAN